MWQYDPKFLCPYGKQHSLIKKIGEGFFKYFDPEDFGECSYTAKIVAQDYVMSPYYPNLQQRDIAYDSIWENEDGQIVYESGLTEQGILALNALEEGLIWDLDMKCIDIFQTKSFYSNISLFNAYRIIEKVKHPDLSDVRNAAMMKILQDG